MDLGYLPWQLADRFADAPSVRDAHAELTYAELDGRVAAVSAHLASRGIGAGQVVAVMLPNRLELVLVIFAAWRLGAAATPVNPVFTAEEAAHQINDADAALVVNAGPGAPSGGRPTIGVDDLALEAEGEVPEPAQLVGSDLALLIYTSGSTGRPKGVMITHANAEAMSTMMADHMALTTDDHAMLILPLFHVNALVVSLLAPLRAGGQLSIIGAFSASSFFDDLERLRPTYFSAVPTIYALLVSQASERRPDTSSLRFAVCGAAPVTPELLHACEDRLGLTMVEGYGLTEATCASACNPIDGVRKLGTVGPALRGQQIRVVDEELQDVPAGQTGEVLISGPTVMAGYLGNPDATEETIVDGWLRTGDVGRLDEDGYLSIVDRIKDMIIRGGENIYPKEIEAVLGQLPQVLEVAVVGRPDDVLGELPVAFIVPYPDATITTEDVLAHCRERLTRTKVPDAVHIASSLPKNPVGKIDKPQIRRTVAAS